jgi:hypothetical protein
VLELTKSVKNYAFKKFDKLNNQENLNLNLGSKYYLSRNQHSRAYAPLNLKNLFSHRHIKIYKIYIFITITSLSETVLPFLRPNLRISAIQTIILELTAQTMRMKTTMRIPWRLAVLKMLLPNH